MHSAGERFALPRPSLALSVLLLAAVLGGPGSGVALSSGAERGGAPTVISLRAAESAALEQPVLRISEQDADGFRLEFELPALAAQSLEVAGERYDLLEIPGGAFAGDVGAPMLPTFSRLIEIPARRGVRVEVTRLETTELSGYRPLPRQPEAATEFVVDATCYDGSQLVGGDPVSLGDPALARGLRVVPITFRPVRYDPAQDRLEVAKRIAVEVHFAGIDLRNTPSEAPRRTPPSFDRLYRRLVVNYEGPRDGQAPLPGSYVLVCPDNPTVVDLLQPLVEWRTRKGCEVHLATTAETGTTREQIQSWLQTAYETWENPPEYVTLVGDVSGTIAIPYWTYGYGESDHPYVLWEGGDYLPEAHVGRISVETYDQLELYVHKIVGYESTPYMAETDWYTRACLTGDPSYSGLTCVQIMQWLKTRLLEYGYTEIDTIFSSPFESQMSASLNRGVTAFAYRGYLGMSGFGTGDIYALQNGW
ncbi:MAG: hypothetical protein GF330_08330, partial [Candidatus Eisenbacteria bacterium]|nr:hypothetical protein [Candidatus Eisenbacteria bacterium]